MPLIIFPAFVAKISELQILGRMKELCQRSFLICVWSAENRYEGVSNKSYFYHARSRTTKCTTKYF